MMSWDILFVPRIIGVVFANGNKTTGPTLSFPFPLNCVRISAKSLAIRGTLIEIRKFETILAHFSGFKMSIDLQFEASLFFARVIVHQCVKTDISMRKF